MCPNVEIKMWILLALGIITGTGSLGLPCTYEESVPLVNRTYIGYKFADNESFVHSETRQERGCWCLKDQCPRKCCPVGQGYSFSLGKCVDTDIGFNPWLWGERGRRFTDFKSRFIRFHTGKMNCTRYNHERRMLAIPFGKMVRLMLHGQLWVKAPTHVPPTFTLKSDKYCIDNFVDRRNYTRINALICIRKTQDLTHHTMLSSCMLICCFFLLLTVAVYALLPELRNLHGMVLITFLLSYFVSNLMLGIMLILMLNNNINEGVCIVLTFVIYFSLLSAILWLNVMCYDIWLTICRRGRLGSAFNRLYSYSMYAFGISLALTIILGVIDFSNPPTKHPLLPNLRVQGCFLVGNSKLMYLYGPILIIFVANIVFITLTAIKILNTGEGSKDSSTHDQQRKDTQRFALYVKLFAVVAINCIGDVVNTFYPKSPFILKFSDAYTLLAGLIIFIMFVGKKKTFKMIKKRFKQLRTGDTMSRTENSTSVTETTISASIRTLPTQSPDELQMNSIEK